MSRSRDSEREELPQAERIRQMVEFNKLLLAGVEEAQKKFMSMGMDKASAGLHACRLFEIYDVDEDNFDDARASNVSRRTGGK